MTVSSSQLYIYIPLIDWKISLVQKIFCLKIENNASNTSAKCTLPYLGLLSMYLVWVFVVKLPYLRQKRTILIPNRMHDNELIWIEFLHWIGDTLDLPYSVLFSSLTSTDECWCEHMFALLRILRYCHYRATFVICFFMLFAIQRKYNEN